MEAGSAGEPTDTGRYVPGSDTYDDFSGEAFPPYWNFIYCPVEGMTERTESGLLLHGNKFTISDDEPKAILLRRQEHFDFCAETKLSLDRRRRVGRPGHPAGFSDPSAADRIAEGGGTGSSLRGRGSNAPLGGKPRMASVFVEFGWCGVYGAWRRRGKLSDNGGRRLLYGELCRDLRFRCDRAVSVFPL